MRMFWLLGFTLLTSACMKSDKNKMIEACPMIEATEKRDRLERLRIMREVGFSSGEAAAKLAPLERLADIASGKPRFVAMCNAIIDEDDEKIQRLLSDETRRRDRAQIEELERQRRDLTSDIKDWVDTR